MPIPREIIERVAKAHKIIRLRQTPGMDYVAVKLNANPTPQEMLNAAMWAASFELADTARDPFALADTIEKIILTGKLPGQ